MANRHIKKLSPPVVSGEIVTRGAPPFNPESLTARGWFQKLGQATQKNVLGRSIAMAEIIFNTGKMQMVFGEHLAIVQKELTPHGVFDDYLHDFGNEVSRSRRSLYRYIDQWKEAAKLPPQIAAAAAAKNYPIERLKTVIKMLPLPKHIESDEQASQIVDNAREYGKKNPQIFEYSRATDEVKVDEELLAKEVTQLFKNYLRKLSARKRIAWGEQIISYQMHIMGLASAKTYAPSVPPAEFVRGRGRPSTKEEKAEAAS